MAVGTRMQQRRAVASVWDVSEYILAPGELGVTTDTGIIKIGDGLNTWSELLPAFNSEFLPILGKAADSELLDGMSSESFAQTIDTPTNTSMADAISAGVATAVSQAKTQAFSRAVTADFTLEVGDINSMVFVTNVNWTPDIFGTIPPDASVAIPVGSFVDICSPNKGVARMVPDSGVTLRGKGIVYGGSSVSRFIKTATDEWLVVNRVVSSPAMVKRFVPTSQTITNGVSYQVLSLAGSNSGVDAPSQMVDSLGASVQYDSAVSTNKLFVRREGWYSGIAQYHLGAQASGRMFAAVYVNGVSQHVGRGSLAGSTSVGVGTNFMLPLLVDDEVQMFGYQETAATRTIVNDPASASFLQWTWVAPL